MIAGCVFLRTLLTKYENKNVCYVDQLFMHFKYKYSIIKYKHNKAIVLSKYKIIKISREVFI